MFVYRFLDRNNNVIYIGKTKDIRQRISTHLSTSGHLPDACYRRINKIEYIDFPTTTDMSIYELYFINKFKPEYNKRDKEESNLSAKIPNIDSWKLYKDFTTRADKDFDSVIKELNETKEELLKTRDLLKKVIAESDFVEPSQTINHTQLTFQEVSQILNEEKQGFYSTELFSNGYPIGSYVVFYKNDGIHFADTRRKMSSTSPKHKMTFNDEAIHWMALEFALFRKSKPIDVDRMRIETQLKQFAI